jgi:sugar lactone lactonase YvrE
MNRQLSLIFRSASVLIQNIHRFPPASFTQTCAEDLACVHERGLFRKSRAKARREVARSIIAALFGALAMNGFAQSGPALSFPTWIPVGSTSEPISVIVVSKAAGTVRNVRVLTQGTPRLEFADAGGSCLGSTFFAAGQTCTESATFTPKSPGVHVGAVELLSDGNSVLATAYLSAVGSGGLGVLLSGQVINVAGSGEWKVVQDGQASQAGLYLPTSIALDGAGNIYISDSLHNRIRKLDTAQTVSTIAGTGAFGYTGDGGPATNATLDTPSGVAVDGAGNIFIADTGNNVIRKIEVATGIMRTVAGNGIQGNSGDNGFATSAELNQPLGVTLDIGGNLYVADTGNNRIRKVDVSSGVMTNFAGSADGTPGYSGDNGPETAAHLNAPNAVAFDLAGNMYIPDALNNVIRKVFATGGITTFAGGGTSPIQYGPSALELQLNGPSGVMVDAAQNVYIADTQNQAIRKVFGGASYFTTIAEFGATAGFFNGKNYQQALYGPTGMVRDANGNIFFADEFNNMIREIQGNRIILDFTLAPTHVGDTSATATQYLENDGNAPLTITSITPDSNAAVDTVVQNSCLTGAVLGPVAGCTIGTQFRPTTTGSPLIGEIDVTADAGGSSPFAIELAGSAIPASATTLTITAVPNPATFEQSVAFEASAVVVPPSGSTATTTHEIPDGTITFLANDGVIGTAILDPTGRATLNYSALPVGTHLIAATYAGNNNFMASSSTQFSQVVQPMPTSTSLGVSSAGGSANTSPSLVATVVGITALTPVPTGSVTFFSGGGTVGTVALNASGVATLIPHVPTGGYTVFAKYSGDAVHAPSSSVAVTVTALPNEFDIDVTPPSLKLSSGQHATVNVTITANTGYSDTVGLGCSSLPASVNCHFSRNNIALAANGSDTVQLTIDTNNPLGGGASAKNFSPGAQGVLLVGTFLPSMFLGFFFWGARRRNPRVFAAVLALLVSAAFLVTGCSGGFTQASASPGTYVIEVTGIGAGGGVSHYHNVTLTITK